MLIDLDDRGLHYGDGLFETIRFAGARAPLWGWHLDRLWHGCERLGLPSPDIDQLGRRVAAASTLHLHSVVKLVYTAGPGPRGYARPALLQPSLLVRASAYAGGAPADLRLRWCAMRMAIQPRLAGIKHLNRIEQVLARNEWSSSDFDEGLMLDMDGRLIAATTANVFVRVDGRWHTPALARCGVEGVARRWMLAETGAEIRDIDPAELEMSDQCVLTNAVRGPLAAAALGEKRWRADAEVRALQQRWAALFVSTEPN
jgi:4-amino-4-deoxychorismate lyase